VIHGRAASAPSESASVCSDESAFYSDILPVFRYGASACRVGACQRQCTEASRSLSAASNLERLYYSAVRRLIAGGAVGSICCWNLVQKPLSPCLLQRCPPADCRRRRWQQLLLEFGPETSQPLSDLIRPLSLYRILVDLSVPVKDGGRMDSRFYVPDAP
jgi:hypothetical protein